MKKIVFNGKFLTQSITGVQRYALEILLELGAIIEPDRAEILVPASNCSYPDFGNIPVVQYGKLKGNLWEQLCLPHYIHKSQAIGVHLCGVAPIVHSDIVCIHDLNFIVNPSFFSLKFRLWYKIQTSCSIHNSKQILTDSEFTKAEIQRVFHVSPQKINVITLGWQHMQRVVGDDDIFKQHPQLEREPYFFAVGSLNKNKNFTWIVEVAKRHPQYVFAIAGGINSRVFGGLKIEPPGNMLFLGYVSDGQMKALMQKCKAFLFPSFYEGFGIPPLEALSVGAKAIVSNTSCLPEIYGDSVAYIDPQDDTANLDELVGTAGSSGLDVLNKYSWREAAQHLYKKIICVNGN